MTLPQRLSVLDTEMALEVLAKALEAQGKDIVHLHVAVPDFQTPASPDAGEPRRRRAQTPASPDAGEHRRGGARQITPNTSLLIINTPANPTHRIIPRAEMDTLVEGLARHPHVVVM